MERICKNCMYLGMIGPHPDIKKNKMFVCVYMIMTKNPNCFGDFFDGKEVEETDSCEHWRAG